MSRSIKHTSVKIIDSKVIDSSVHDSLEEAVEECEILLKGNKRRIKNGMPEKSHTYSIENSDGIVVKVLK